MKRTKPKASSTDRHLTAVPELPQPAFNAVFLRLVAFVGSYFGPDEGVMYRQIDQATKNEIPATVAWAFASAELDMDGSVRLVLERENAFNREDDEYHDFSAWDRDAMTILGYCVLNNIPCEVV